jgi:hypothetical protein
VYKVEQRVFKVEQRVFKVEQRWMQSWARRLPSPACKRQYHQQEPRAVARNVLGNVPVATTTMRG